MTIYIHSQPGLPLRAVLTELIDLCGAASLVLLVDARRPDYWTALHQEYGALLPPEAIRAWQPPVGETGEACAKLQELIAGSVHPDLMLEVRGSDLYLVGGDYPEAGNGPLSPRQIARMHQPPQIRLTSRTPPACAVIFAAGTGRLAAIEEMDAILPAICENYEVTLVCDQWDQPFTGAARRLPVRSPAWLLRHRARFDHLLYHVENLTGGCFIPELLSKAPGLVILHNFDLPRLYDRGLPKDRDRAIREQYGLGAVMRTHHGEGDRAARPNLPMNLAILQHATGVITLCSRVDAQAQGWYGPQPADFWHSLPRVRALPNISEALRRTARVHLGYGENETVVCAFGHIGIETGSIEALLAFARSRLADLCNGRFILVGPASDEARETLFKVAKSQNLPRFEIAEPSNAAIHQEYLLAADIGLILGEGDDGRLLDCLRYGVPAITDIDSPDQAAVLAQNAPMKSVGDIAGGLKDLAFDPARRAEVAETGRRFVAQNHDAGAVARAYIRVMEQTVNSPRHHLAYLPVSEQVQGLGFAAKVALAQSLAFNFPPVPRLPVLYIDATVVARLDSHTGIQRVVRAIIRSLFDMDDLPYVVAPVRLGDEGKFHHALRFGERIAGLVASEATERPVDFYPGDVLLAIDLDLDHTKIRHQTYDGLRARGVGVWHVVHDLLPVHLPQYFPAGDSRKFADWLQLVGRCDGAICVSDTTAGNLRSWLEAHASAAHPMPQIGRFHLGADLECSAPTMGLPADATQNMALIAARPTFLMVGTLEPRKGYAQALAAFELLWEKGVAANLVIVGKKGWRIGDLARKLASHKQKDTQLLWLSGISDEFLELIYRQSDCLVFASEGEGFGLPLIEAARHGLPILARDIPIIREVAGAHAAYFNNSPSPEVLCAALEQWLAHYRAGTTIASTGLPSLSWAQSAAAMIEQMSIRRRPARDN